jgi:hypothetical protein
MQYQNGETKLIDDSFELTINDLNLLEQFRLKRLRGLFSQSLSHCLIHVDCRKTLIVRCSKSKVLDSMLNDLEDLCDYATLILGANEIVIYSVQEEIYRAAIESIWRHPQ